MVGNLNKIIKMFFLLFFTFLLEPEILSDINLIIVRDGNYFCHKITIFTLASNRFWEENEKLVGMSANTILFIC